MNSFIHTQYDLPGAEPVDRYAFDGTPANEAICHAIADILDRYAPPAGTPVVIKPNLNNDLCALTGNSADLRILAALFKGLKSKGISDILLAEGMNVGIDRRNIDGFKRLRIDRLAKKYGVRLLNVNKATPLPVRLTNSEGRIAREIHDAEFLINVCKIKTHTEAVFSGAMKNWVGISVGQYKRRMHDSLAENIVRVNDIVRPHLVIADGLVGMAGNGPGDGYPVRLDTILAGGDPAAIDLFSCRLIGMAPSTVPSLAIACARNPALAVFGGAIKEKIKPIAVFEQAPPRSRLARLSDAPSLRWLKKFLQPLLSEGPLLRMAYRLKIVQDVYSLEDDSISSITIARERVQFHDDQLRRICPGNWDKVRADTDTGGDRITVSSSAHCLGCLYCFWVLPANAVRISGDPGFLARQIAVYKSRIENLFDGVRSSSISVS